MSVAGFYGTHLRRYSCNVAFRFGAIYIKFLGTHKQYDAIDLPDPIEAIKFRMEQSGLTPKELVLMIGCLNRVHEVLNRKRSLTLPMIWKLHKALGIPAASLIHPAATLPSAH
ncbi:MAG: hypothetical protein HOP02_08925 [Methylococcaceae bacterium]|nr:hypothetical protein [Methylococcaceae bacterium]